MTHIPFPFSYGKMLIKFENNCISCTAEIADSTSTIYQALNYRSKEEFIHPLVLLFPDPGTPYLVRFNFPFAVELIEVAQGTRYGSQPAQTYPGTFVKNYVGFKGLVILPQGFFQSHGYNPSCIPFGPPPSTYIGPRVKIQLKKYGKYFPHGTELL